MTIISIVGNPNVGKSTLFNRLITDSHKAITSDFSGVTRDYKKSQAKLADLTFKLVDTAGLHLNVEKRLNELDKKIQKQTISAISKSDIVLFMVDGKIGVTEQDKAIARLLRSKDLLTILVINKMDNKKAQSNIYEFHNLGYRDLCAISAEHNLGLNSLYELISEHIDDTLQTDIDESKIEILKIAIIGKPNVGKSTLINALLDEDRLITDQIAGVTRDSITVDFVYKGKNIEIIDTAGMRKQRNVNHKIEKLSVQKSIETINMCDVVVLMIDANSSLERQDLKIASVAIQRSYKPVVIAVNKIDSIDSNKDTLAKDIDYLVKKKLSILLDIPILYISALYKKNINKILDQCIKLHTLWNTKISTSKLNNWLKDAIERHQPPLSKQGRRIKLKFINQLSSAPPIFQIFSSNHHELPDNYLKYLTKSLQDTFKFSGIPIRINKVKTKNPYVN